MVLSAVGRFTEEYSQNGDRHANYSYVTWRDLKEMIVSGLVEVQNHTYDMHETNGKRKGAMKVNGENPEHYKSALSADVTKMQAAMQEHTGYTPLLSRIRSAPSAKRRSPS